MSDLSFTREERDEIVEAFNASVKQTSWPVYQTLDTEQRRAEYARQEELLAEYAERLPFLELSRCPFTGTVLEYPLDPYGFDGPYWRPREIAHYPPPRGGPHFRMLLGAVEFHGRQPVEAEVTRKVLPGPGVPFVVPTLFKIDGMQAVVSSLTLPRGDTAYLVAWYSEKPVHGAFLHQPWGREAYAIHNLAGEFEGWGYSTWEWSFDLAPWLENGRLQWIAPGDASLELRGGVDCPYVGLEGVQAPQVIERGELHLGTLPSGGQPDPMD